MIGSSSVSAAPPRAYPMHPSHGPTPTRWWPIYADPPGQRVGSVNTLRTQMTLMRLVEILDSQFEPLAGTLQALSSLELDDREEALRTLDAFFTYPGNASEAARHLHVHPNTFRYRLAKVADILGIDLDDRDTRIVVEIDLLRHRYGGINARRT